MTPEELSSLERRHVWHPFTQMRDWEAGEPLFIESGDGVKLRDIHGREYYDGNSSLWVNVHGHRHPALDAAVQAQLGKLAHSTMLGLTHPLAAELAARLVRIAPTGLQRVFYSDSGSEAVEIALKMTYQYWRHRGQEQRSRYIGLSEGYHGDTVGAVSIGGIPLFHGIFRRLLFEAHFAPCPAQFSTAEEAAEGMEALLREHGDTVAAVVVEPLIQGAGGMLVHPRGYLRRVRELCDRYGTLLIVDEVATGFGRTGRMFACEHEEVSPDLMCVAKGITGGYLPLAATLTTEEIYSAFLGDFAERKTFYHGHSYTGNPLACAAAVANLEIFERERVIDGLAPKIDRVREGLRRFRELPHVAEIRQCGLMIGIELAADPARGEPYPWQEAVGARVCMRARELGMITRPLGDVVIFMPPLASTEADLDAMLEILYRAIRLETEGDGAGPGAA
ncbi:MAG: adenosylmethionine--8-amino-7-oxononanoate transaminase [Armatimonadota bacterium]